jgi:hypothetical protein
VLVERRRGKRREKGAEVIDDNIVEPPRGGEHVKKVRSVQGPELSVVVKGKLRGGRMRVQEGTQPLFVRVLRGDAKTRGAKRKGRHCVKGMEEGRKRGLPR